MISTSLAILLSLSATSISIDESALKKQAEALKVELADQVDRMVEKLLIPESPIPTLIDGTLFPQHALAPYPSVPGTYASPWVVADHGEDFVVENLVIQNFENNKAYLATMSRDRAYLAGKNNPLPKDFVGDTLAWKSFTLRNVVMKNHHRNFTKSQGVSIHADGLYVRFGVKGQKILVENLHMENMGGGVMPFLITDNKDVALIHLKNVSTKDVSHSPAIKSTTGDLLIIEDCPNLKNVNLLQSKFKKIQIINSPTTVTGTGDTVIEKK